MKLTNQLTASLVGLGLLTTALAQNNAQAPKFKLPDAAPAQAQSTAPVAAPVAAPATPAAPAAPAVKYTQAQLMEAYGITFAIRSNLGDLEFTAADIDSMAKGMKMYLAGEKPSYANDSQAVNQQLGEMISQKQQALLSKIKTQNVATSEAFFAKAKTNKAIQFSSTGLGIEQLKAGTGAIAKAGQLVKFHFTMYSLDGQQLSSSAGQPPVEGIVKEGDMMPGLIEGLQKVAVGGKARLYIPYTIAFGEEGGQGLAPAASLVFEVEVIEVTDAPKEVAPAAPAK